MICIFNIVFFVYLWGINGWLLGYLIKGKGIYLEYVGWLLLMLFIVMLLGEIIGVWLFDYVDRCVVVCFIFLVGVGIGLVVVMYFIMLLLVIVVMSFSIFMWGIGVLNIFVLLVKVIYLWVSVMVGGIFNGLGNFVGVLLLVVMGVFIVFIYSMDFGLIFLVVMVVVGCVLLLLLLRCY